MSSRRFGYCMALWGAGLVWVGLLGLARADEPTMTFNGKVQASGSVEASAVRSGPLVTVITSNGSVGLQHISSADETFPRVFSFIQPPENPGVGGPGNLAVQNSGGAPDNKVILHGEGQTQFNGGPVVIGATRWQGNEQIPAKCNYLNVYSGNSPDDDDALLSPQDLRFETSDGGGTVRAARLGGGSADLRLKAGSLGQAGHVVIERTGMVCVTGDAASTPSAKLHVQGAVFYEDCPTLPETLSGGGQIYASGGELYAKDASGTATGFSPHMDPRSIDPQAQTSFADPSVALPFSFYHKNSLVGKGEVVDMAKMVAFVESQMKAQLGDQAGNLRYDYDLPAGEKTTIEQFEQQRVRQQAEEVVMTVESMDWIPAPLGANGEFPAEAVEEVPEFLPELRDSVIREPVPDFAAGRIVTRERHEWQRIPVPTGRMTKRFKADWKFENGVLYRRPTVADVNLEDFVKPSNWPQWILDRVPGGARQISQSASQLIGQIKAMLAQLAKKGSSQVAEAKTGQGK